MENNFPKLETTKLPIKKSTLLPLLLVLAALPVLLITVNLSQQPQEIRQHAASVTFSGWQQTTPWPSGSRDKLPSFAVGNRYYVYTDQRMYFATQQPDGSLSPWQNATNTADHWGPQGFSAVSTGAEAYLLKMGRIARYNFNADGTLNGFTYFEKMGTRPDNSVFSEGFPENGCGNYAVSDCYEYYFWDSDVFVDFPGSSYLFDLGGWDMASYYYNFNLHRLALPAATNAQFAHIGSTDHPYKAAFYRAPGAYTGYIYTGNWANQSIRRLQVNSDGSVGGWIDTAGMPAQGGANERGDIFVIGSQLFVIRGSKVYYADIAADGSLSGWNDAPPDLPEEQMDMTWGNGVVEGASYGVIGNYVYVTGKNRVWYSQITGYTPPTAEPTPTSAPVNIGLYFNPDPVESGQNIAIIATGPSSCSLNVGFSSAGLTNCYPSAGFTCDPTIPKPAPDSNPCWWQWTCTAGSIPSSYDATFTADNNPACTKAASYQIIPAVVPPTEIPTLVDMRLYFNPDPVEAGQNVDIIATGPVSCSAYVGISSVGFGNCIESGGFACNDPAKPNPEPDGNPCWWKWTCTVGSTEGFFDAIYTANNDAACTKAASYQINAAVSSPIPTQSNTPTTNPTFGVTYPIQGRIYIPPKVYQLRSIDSLVFLILVVFLGGILLI